VNKHMRSQVSDRGESGLAVARGASISGPPGIPDSHAAACRPSMRERSFPRGMPRYTQTPARPDLLPLPEQPGGRPVTLTPGRALIALLGELDACGLPVTGMNLTRLQGTLTLPDGLAVSYCCGWLAWPAGRPSGRGRPLHTLHNAHDPAGAARRLAGCVRDEAGGSTRP
jgi:hypothetical protein